jgi:hypothetical protein
MKTTGIRVVVLDLELAYAAGAKWKEHLDKITRIFLFLFQSAKSP